jgi:hypothetical protein
MRDKRKKDIHVIRYFFALVFTVHFGCSTVAKNVHQLNTVEKPAILSPDEEIEIVKIDNHIVDIKHHGEIGSPFSSISINPDFLSDQIN